MKFEQLNDNVLALAKENNIEALKNLVFAIGPRDFFDLLDISTIRNTRFWFVMGKIAEELLNVENKAQYNDTESVF